MAVADQVKDALGALPDDLRRPIELAYFGGHTYREVAQILEEPEGTVKSRIRSGLGPAPDQPGRTRREAGRSEP